MTPVFRLFISSTFGDFAHERDALRKDVFPELNKYCEKKGARFQPVDLRWGVTEEATRKHDTLRICLEEVRRCQHLSPRPNFVVLLGDRYGWEPLPARIPLDQWDRLIAAAELSDRYAIEAGYEGPDLNAIPPLMRLNVKKEREAALQTSLRRAANAAGFTSDKERLPYFASATHQEIALGALYTDDKVLHPQEDVYVYVRHIEGLPNDGSARAFIDWDEERQAPMADARQKLSALKLQLRERLPGKVHDIHAYWLDGDIDRSHLGAFCAQFLADQIAIIERELVGRKNLSDGRLRDAQHRDFASKRARNFQGRESVFEKITAYIRESGVSQPLIVHGDGGIGKSALMAYAYLSATETARETSVILARFIGGVPGTESVITLLTELTADIAAAYGQAAPSIPENTKAACQAFKKALEGATVERPLVVFLDAIDQLDQDDGAWMLEWLPEEIGEHTRIVASTREGKALLSAQNRYPRTLLEVPVMTLSEGRRMLDAWLADAREAHYNSGITPSFGRRLTNAQYESVLSVFALNGKPLWLKLAYEDCRHWTSWDEGRALLGTVEAMVDDLITHRLLEGESHPRAFATRALAYLTAGRFGLSDEELDYALATDPEVKAEFEMQNKKTGHRWEPDNKRPKLPPILWSRLYFDLEPYLTVAHVDSTVVYRWFHREFHYSLGRRIMESEPERAFIHGHLADTHRFLDAASRSGESGDDRLFAHTYPYGDQSPTALRRIMEQPWQLARAIGGTGQLPYTTRTTKSLSKLEAVLVKRRRELKALLSDFGFCQAKVYRVDDLIRDWKELPPDGPEARRWQRFLSTRASILRQHRYETGWPANRVLLQLALEEDPQSFVTKSAIAWLDRCKPEWTVVSAPLARSTRSSIQISASGSEPARDVYIDREGRILLEKADGSARAYDPDDGRFLGEVNAVERPVVSSSDAPPTSSGPGMVWPLRRGEWFRWQGESDGGGPNGTASLYDPHKGDWTALPQIHHKAVWDAVPLLDGGFATLGLNANRGVLAIWSPHRPAELLGLDVFCPHSPESAGILELGDQELVVWPAFSDGCGLWLRSCSFRGVRRWRAEPLSDATSAIHKAIRIDDARFITLSNEGEVRIWFTKYLERPNQPISRPSTYPRSPRHRWLARANPSSHWDALAADRRLDRIFKTSDGRLFASDSRHGDGWLLEWTGVSAPSFQIVGDQPSNLNLAKLPSAEMDLDARLTAPRNWQVWVDRAMKEGAKQFQADTAIRLSAPDAQDSNPEVWGRWLYHYLCEDFRRPNPLLSDSERLLLIKKALEVLSKLTPGDVNNAILLTEVHRHAARRWRDSLAISPLNILLEQKPHDEQLMLAWVAFCESESSDWGQSQCAEFARLRPESWALLLRCAQIAERNDPNAAREFRLQAVNRLGLAASVRFIPGTEIYGLWEIYFNGRCSVWASDRPGPYVFAVDGDRLILAGAPIDGIRYLTFERD